jgi:hypothetical protein
MPLDPENILKGRIGECLVEELLKQCGNKVYRFGYEAVLQNLTQLEKAFDRDSEIGQRISSIPDFIVINQKGKPFFVEVKFRTDPKIYPADAEHYFIIEEFWKSKIILLTLQKPYFRISNILDFNDRKELNWRPLEKDNNFEINPEILKQFYLLIEKYCISKNNQNVKEKI